jgi:ParB-like chromosome segregation protein Spo0J
MPAPTPATRSPWATRIVRHAEEKPADLVVNPKNWRKHDQRQEQALTEALETAGWVQPVIVNQETGHLLDGHLRVMLAIKRSTPTIPVSYVSLTEEEERLILATLDPISGLAVNDEGALRGLLSDIEDDLGETLTGLMNEIAPASSHDERESSLPTQEQIDRRSEEIETRFDDFTRGDVKDVTCPECGGSFGIDVAEFKRDDRYDR